MKFLVPVRVSGPNLREHHHARARRVAKERQTTQLAALADLGLGWPAKVALPATVTMTRIGKRLLDDDNLSGACKAIRDEIAKQLGVSDGPRGPVTWRYDQRQGKAFAVEVHIAQGAP